MMNTDIVAIATALNLYFSDGIAIAAALSLYFSEVHDTESNILTINRAGRKHSSWNSKLFGMNNLN
ncbi:MAG: hypothetical protein LBV31_01370 [Prevotellaceae bacterium]|jgi:hypothetical protein|nr:hypothetical protein [Prevotellaceae bacterium]